MKIVTINPSTTGFKTQMYAGKWCDGFAACRAIFKNSNNIGIRIVIMYWAATGITSIRVMKGDGRGDNFNLFEEVELTPVEAEHEEAVVDCLIGKYFA